jgi:hypothetical protein
VISKQALLFPDCEADAEQKYSTTVAAPVYEPSHNRPHLLALCDSTKTQRLIRQVDASDLPEAEKEFLRAAAWRHTVFHYERIADYYAHATPAMQRMMEDSALVIIDFDSAIERGFVQLCDGIRKQHLEEYNSDGDAS